MPALDVDYATVPSVASCTVLLEELLQEADAFKSSCTIEPTLNKSDFNDLTGRISRFADSLDAEIDDMPSNPNAQLFTVIETAVRDIFSNHIVSPNTFPDMRAQR